MVTEEFVRNVGGGFNEEHSESRVLVHQFTNEKLVAPPRVVPRFKRADNDLA